MLKIAQNPNLANPNLKNFFKSMYFLRRHGIFQEIQGFLEFLWGNSWHFEAKKARKLVFLD
jgi:hypothetical protein